MDDGHFGPMLSRKIGTLEAKGEGTFGTLARDGVCVAFRFIKRIKGATASDLLGPRLCRSLFGIASRGIGPGATAGCHQPGLAVADDNHGQHVDGFDLKVG